MVTPAIIIDKNELVKNNNPLVLIHTGDWHLGNNKMVPDLQYKIIKEQFINPLYSIDFDILTINGDYFDKKLLANTQAIAIGCLLFKELIDLCKTKKATFMIISGTKEHDNDQLKLFYPYLMDKDIDLRIIEYAKFEYVKGVRILCLPEEYNKSKTYYDDLLIYSGIYDICIMHGMFDGAIYQNKVITFDDMEKRNKIFTIDDFCNCKGYISAGHVHTAGCFKGYFYYCGSPYRWQFGEEQPKGFMISLYNKDTRMHYMYMQEIISNQYATTNLDDILDSNYPEDIIYYINSLLDDIEFIRIEFVDVSKKECLSKIEVIKTYYKNNNRVKIKIKDSKKAKIIQEVIEQNDKLKEFMFVLDKNLSVYEKLSRYINIMEKKVCISPEDIKYIIDNDI